VIGRHGFASVGNWRPGLPAQSSSSTSPRAESSEVARFLGDKRRLVSRIAIERHARNWRALISRVHHAVEPYYVIAAAASLVIGAISYLISRLA
jgi:hypothetical protein